MRTKITVTSLLPPTHFISPMSKKHYIVPGNIGGGWIEIQPDFDIKTDLIWVKPEYKKDKELGKIPASKGDTVYTISETKKGEIVCDCPGFKYRGRTCKHIQPFKMKKLLAK